MYSATDSSTLLICIISKLTSQVSIFALIDFLIFSDNVPLFNNLHQHDACFVELLQNYFVHSYRMALFPVSIISNKIQPRRDVVRAYIRLFSAVYISIVIVFT